jgi:hypothetical protein
VLFRVWLGRVGEIEVEVEVEVELSIILGELGSIPL